MMSLGMAAMLWPWGNPVPALYWQVLFSIVAAWFALRLLRRGTRSATIPQPGPGIALPALAWAFVAYFLVFAV